MEKHELEFTKMILENKSTIYTVCYMFSKDKNEINDLFQEILIRLWKGYDSFLNKSDIRTWIYMVSLNSIIGTYEGIILELENPKAAHDIIQ